jgi:exodeoxyribonuclease V beta subunit
VDPWSDPSADEAAAALELAPFDRHLDRSVARWSFTAITHHAGADLTDPYDPNGADGGAGDEAGAGGPAGGVDPAGEVPTTVVDGGPVAPFSLLGAGTVFGTFVHSVLEVVDFAGPDLEEALRAAVHDQAIRVGMDLTSLAPTGSDAATLLVDGLQRTIRTPLGPLFGGSALVDLHRSERLDELSFDLRLGTGRRRPRVRDIGRLVSAHLPAGAPLAPWADALAHGAIDLELGGFLTGSIDLVARVHAVDGPDGYVVADYKTNRLTRRGARPGDDDYAQGRLLDAMVEHHYPLQALLYAVALHRYLRWRLGAAEEGTHVRGAAYLFVRGMTGRDVPVIDGRPHGVVTWELPAELIVGLSDLLARGSAPGARP